MRAGEKKRGVLAAGSGPDAVLEAVGRGGAAVIGHVPGAAALATELVRRGVHVMVYDVNSCAPGEWDGLERAAARARVRLRCGSHLARFAPVMAGVRAYAGGHVSIAAKVTGKACGSDVCALAADVAMATFGGAPQAAFAVAPENPHSYGADGDKGAQRQVFAGAPEGNERGVADHTAAMLRFTGGRAALLSIDSLFQEGNGAMACPPDVASAKVEICGHGGLLRRASLGAGSIDARRPMAPATPPRGMYIGGFEGGDGHEEGPGGGFSHHAGQAWAAKPASGHEAEPGDGLARYRPAMLADLETGEAPAWPPAEWAGRGVSGVPDVPPWWRERATWKAGQPARASLPPPSSLAHVMEAILVSINTGAPVYLDQR